MTTLHIPPPATRKPESDPVPKEGTDRFAALVHAVYQDGRADRQSRELLHAMAYALTVGRVPDRSAWQTAGTVLGHGPTGRPRIKELAALDVPRYVEPGQESFVEGACEAARHRPYVPRNTTRYGKAKATDDWRNTSNQCGAHGTIRITEKNPRTGWHSLRWYCSRHRAEANRVAAQLQVQNDAAPAPIPNRGGLLPVFFRAEWETVYRWALGNPSWEPPVRGISADDWPSAGQTPLSRRPRLSLVLCDDLDGEQSPLA